MKQKLTAMDVRSIRMRYKLGQCGKGPRVAHIDFAQEYDVSTHVIHSLITGKTYRSVKPAA